MPTSQPTIDVFCASIGRVAKLTRMIESVRATGYPARVLVGAGDLDTTEACLALGDGVECVFNSAANRRAGCTAALNSVFRLLVRTNAALFCTDDIVFEPECLHIAMETLRTRFPDGDGVVGLTQANIPDGHDLAFPLMGSRFLDRFRPGDLFCPDYFHQYNDAELGLTIKHWGNWCVQPQARVVHHHPDVVGEPHDTTHVHARTRRDDDDALWAERRRRGLLWMGNA